MSEWPQEHGKAAEMVPRLVVLLAACWAQCWAAYLVLTKAGLKAGTMAVWRVALSED